MKTTMVSSSRDEDSPLVRIRRQQERTVQHSHSSLARQIPARGEFSFQKTQRLLRGIVRTVNNFGANGEKPTHPELLDHLATGLMDSGWSIRSLIQLQKEVSLAKTPSLLTGKDLRRLRGAGP